jgi:hypothetical protein
VVLKTSVRHISGARIHVTDRGNDAWRELLTNTPPTNFKNVHRPPPVQYKPLFAVGIVRLSTSLSAKQQSARILLMDGIFTRARSHCEVLIPHIKHFEPSHWLCWPWGPPAPFSPPPPSPTCHRHRHRRHPHRPRIHTHRSGFSGLCLGFLTWSTLPSGRPHRRRRCRWERVADCGSVRSSPMGNGQGWARGITEMHKLTSYFERHWDRECDYMRPNNTEPLPVVLKVCSLPLGACC